MPDGSRYPTIGLRGGNPCTQGGTHLYTSECRDHACPLRRLDEAFIDHIADTDPRYSRWIVWLAILTIVALCALVYTTVAYAGLVAEDDAHTTVDEQVCMGTLDDPCMRHTSIFCDSLMDADEHRTHMQAAAVHERLARRSGIVETSCALRTATVGLLLAFEGTEPANGHCAPVIYEAYLVPSQGWLGRVLYEVVDECNH